MKAILSLPPAGEGRNEVLPYSFGDRLLVRVLSPGAMLKLPVPKIYEPRMPEGSAHAALQELQGHFEDFAAVLQKADEKRLKGIHVASPANSRICPSVIAYLDATVQHNRYHWLQIEALLQNPKFSSA